MGMMEFANRRRSDFVMQPQVSNNMTSRLLAYRDGGSTLTSSRGGLSDGPPSVQNSVIDDDLKWNVSVYNIGISPVLASSEIQRDYDAEGAMYFSIAVILIYGISIALLVAASTLLRSDSDYELKSFLRSYSRIDDERRSREKQRIRAVLQRFDWLAAAPGGQRSSQPPPPAASLVAVAAAPHAAVSFRISSAGTPSVLRPATLSDARTDGGILRTPAESAWQPGQPDCSTTLATTDRPNHHRDNNGDELEINGHEWPQQQQPVTRMTQSHHGSYFFRHLSESSLLVPKSGSKSASSASNRRYTFV